MLRLTPAQVVGLAQVSPETLRHWRKVLAPLKGYSGRGPCFLPGDALALAIVRNLVKDMGIQVGTLSRLAPRLFEICRTTSWPMLKATVLLLRPEQGTVDARQQDARALDQMSIVIPLGSIVDALERELRADDANSAQMPLRIRPSVLRRTKTGR